MLTFDQAWQVGQTVFLIVLGIGASWTTWVTTRKKKKATGSKIPGDAVARSSQDDSHEVKRLVAEVERLFGMVTTVQNELSDTIKELNSTRKEVARLNDLYLKTNENVYALRRIVRRYMDKWPSDKPQPTLSYDEMVLVGLDPTAGVPLPRGTRYPTTESEDKDNGKSHP